MPNDMSMQQPMGNPYQGFGQQQGSFGYGNPQYSGGHGGYGGGWGGWGGYPGMTSPMQHPQHLSPQPWMGTPYSGGYGNFYGLPLGGWSGQYAGQFGGPFASPGYGFGTPLTPSGRDPYSSF
ncbi:hypothetical protein [Pradoshia sp.]